MVPAAVIILAIAIGVLIYGFHMHTRHAILNGKVKKLDAKIETMRAFMDDVIVGHAHEVRLKRALSRMYGDEE